MNDQSILMPAPVVVASSEDGRILDVNDSFTEITGYTADEVVSKKATDLPLWKHPEKRNLFLEQIQRGKDVVNEQVSIIKKNGREIQVQFSMLKLNQPANPVVLSIAYTIAERESNPYKETNGRSRSTRPDHANYNEYEVNPAGKPIASDKKVHSRIALPTNEGLTFINVSEILYFKASGNYTEIFMTDGKKHLVSKVLQLYEKMMTGYNFFRIHHSTLVHIDHIEKYIKGDGGYVVLSDNTSLGLSRRKRDAFLHFIGCKASTQNG